MEVLWDDEKEHGFLLSALNKNLTSALAGLYEVNISSIYMYIDIHI